MNNLRLSEAAMTLHSYMNFRAKAEGVEHAFSAAFYADALRYGVRTFFGIDVDGATGSLVRNVQNPATFAAFFKAGRPKSLDFAPKR